VSGHDRPENPFCSRRVRPGAIPFLFAAGQSAAALIERLQRSGWWGQIVGPHGSGKSALLAALVPAIEQAGRRVVQAELHDGQRHLPAGFPPSSGLDAATVLAVDGYEQLGRGTRFWLKRFCRRGGVGLLVTAHDGVGLPELCRTAPNLSLARQVLDQLQRGYPPHVMAEDLAEPFARHGGNLREVLFDLYDLYQRRSGQPWRMES
jgi:hypothetical protein